MNKLLLGILIIIIIAVGCLVGYLLFERQGDDFEELSTIEMLEQITKNRDFAIQKAMAAGDYRCCIDPPCTMCFMEANKWNNFEAGTCACDDLIAQGKEACPQCQGGLKKDTGVSCEISSEACGEE